MKRIPIILFLSFIVSGCILNDTKEKTNNGNDISGFVIGEEGVGEDGVSINLVGNDYLINTFTDKHGYYFFSSIPNGAYRINASKKGYSFSPNAFTIIINTKLDIQNIYVDSLFYCFQGNAIDENGNGISDVSALFYCNNHPLYFQTKSDSSGFFSCDIPRELVSESDNISIKLYHSMYNEKVVEIENNSFENIVIDMHDIILTNIVNENSDSGESATDFLPLTTGSTYTYREISTYGDVEDPYIDNYTTTIHSTVSKNGKTYSMLTDAYEGWTDTTYARIANNIVYALETFYDMYKTSAAKAGVAIPKLADEYTPVEIPFLNFGANTWTIYTHSQNTEYGSTSLSWSGEYIGRETVTVPAGTFQNCVVFELTMGDESTYSYQGYSYSFSGEEKMKIWCAEGVGWVKTYSVYSYDDGNDDDHGNDVTTTELMSYSIP